MATAQPTTDHDEIRKWVEARGGHPARVKKTGKRGDPGILRIDFPGFSGEGTLEEIEWEEFFEWFDRDRLALLLSPTRGNRFNKFVARTTVKAGGSKKATSAKKASSTKKAAGAKKASSTKKASSSKKTTKKAASTKKASSAKKASSSKKASSKKASVKRSSSTKKASTSKKTAKKATSTKKATTAKKGGGAKKSATTKKASSSKKSVVSRVVSAVRAATKRGGSKKASSSKKKSSGSSKTTTNRDEIVRWVEARGGFPAHVTSTAGRGNDPGVLRIDYPGFSGTDTLERISWDQWFEWFDRDNLAFLYQDKKNSRFSKLVAR